MGAPARTGPDYAIARAFREKVKWGEVAAIKNMIKNGQITEHEIALPGETMRQWTALHIAAWGTAKPQYDREGRGRRRHGAGPGQGAPPEPGDEAAQGHRRGPAARRQAQVRQDDRVPREGRLLVGWPPTARIEPRRDARALSRARRSLR